MKRATPGKQLQRMREQMLKQQDKVKLVELTQRLKAARTRRDAALKQTRTSCRRWRVEASAKAKKHRTEELARIKRETKELRQQARNRCQLRRHKIRTSGAKAVEVRRELLEHERKHQAQLKRLAEHARKRMAKHSTKSKERRQESDDYVRGNLPPELQGVFDRVKRQIKGGPRTTRTEAFLEWAAENPGDVLRHQEHATEREIAELVREHEETAKRLRKGKRHYRELALGMGVPF
jgi:hypothetical protein